MNQVILDARPAAAHEAGHLPGALHADLEKHLAAPDDPSRGGRHPLPPIERWLEQVAAWGITPSTHVIVYDDQRGANAAARVWWMLRAIGHENVEVLDDWKRHAPSPVDSSSLEASIRQGSSSIDSSFRQAGAPVAPQAGAPVTPQAGAPVAPQAGAPVAPQAWQLPTVDMDTVDRLRSDLAWKVLDVRSAERFRGETEPIDPIAGHIPGAVNLPYTENDGKSPVELRSMYEKLLDGVPPERLIVHCGSGVTACHTLLALDRAGLHGVSLYVGSWGEWCRRGMPMSLRKA